MAITYFDPKTARGSVDCGKCLRARFRYMGEVCTLVLFIFLAHTTVEPPLTDTPNSGHLSITDISSGTD